MAPNGLVKGSACSSSLRIAFIHPDLGLGGAERLIVDAAAELVRCGHIVDVYTPYYNPKRCFEETKTAGFAVHVAGGWFPRHIMGRMIALCAYVRCVFAALHIAIKCFFGKGPSSPSGSGPAGYDVIIADQVSVVVPVLKALLPRTKVLFYCHFPDLLLSTKRASLLKRLYRAPLDYVEEATTGAADLILVNSNYTRGIFAQTFKRLAARGLDPGVLYPAVQIPDPKELQAAEAGWRQELDPDLAAFVSGGPTFLSINRFERKKGVGLALEALHELLARQRQDVRGQRGGPQDMQGQRAGQQDMQGQQGRRSPAQAAAAGAAHGQCAVPSAPAASPPEPPADGEAGAAAGTGGSEDGGPRPAAPAGQQSVQGGQRGQRGPGQPVGGPRLVLAGGYDPRLAENVEHLAELRGQAAALGLGERVRFVPSFTDRQRTLLLAACRAVLYTPQNEHFGIVPLEAMAAGRPVVACASGGPTESVAHGSVGLLAEPTPAAFAAAMGALLAGSDGAGGGEGGKAAAMGAAARAHVEGRFSRRAFGAQLDEHVRRLAAAGSR